MNINEIFKSQGVTLSFEFFPPKTELAGANLYKAIDELKDLKPSYVSVTYGAGGTTRSLTHDLVARIRRELALPVVPHLTCVDASREETYEILKNYHGLGVRDIMALRGDPPKDRLAAELKGDFPHAADLVAFIKLHFPDMGVGVAGFPEGHPETPNRLKEIEHLKAKIDAGADYICSQLFFDNRDFYDFRERCVLAGINVPIVAGIMPIASQRNLERMADLASGSRFPAPLLRVIARAGDDDYVEKAGIHWAAEQVRDLLDKGVRGIHFYTLNKASQVRRICESVGIHDTEQLNRRAV